MYTHTGTTSTPLITLAARQNLNQVSAQDALGVRGWTKSGVDRYPHIIARGVLIDVAKFKNVDRLPASYAITVADLQGALLKQGTTI
jgi:hypothetical protein